MNIVFVNFQDSCKPYLFAVPDGVTLAKGTEVVCDTCKGETTGKCFTQSIDVSRSAVEYFGPLMGAYFPLKNVVGEVRRQVIQFPKEERNLTKFKIGDVVVCLGKHHDQDGLCYPEKGTMGKVKSIYEKTTSGQTYKIRWEPESTSGDDIWWAYDDDIEPYNPAEKPTRR